MLNFTFRSAILVIAALGASSVAPAQVAPLPEPLIGTGSTLVPAMVVPQAIELLTDELAPGPDPAIDSEAPETEAVAEPATTDQPKPTGNLSSLVSQLRSSDPGSRELECLAGAIYFESKSEPLSGQLAVGQVIANRSKSGRFPSSYCGVVFQRSQFSFVRGRAMPPIPRSSHQWKTAVAVAQIVHQALHVSTVPKALFFHARRVSPRWRLTRVGTVGNHVFYR
jgi:spore germination cell wall hydrolase CwlJ-like protein